MRRGERNSRMGGTRASRYLLLKPSDDLVAIIIRAAPLQHDRGNASATSALGTQSGFGDTENCSNFLGLELVSRKNAKGFDLPID